MRTALFAIAAAAALAACSGKKEPPPAPGSAATATPPPAADPAPAAKPAPGSAPAPTPTPSAAASGDFPEACGEYRQTIERLATCGDALPQATRDNLRTLFDKQWAEWSKLPEQDRRTLAAICKSSADSVKTAAAAACGW